MPFKFGNSSNVSQTTLSINSEPGNNQFRIKSDFQNITNMNLKYKLNNLAQNSAINKNNPA